MRDERAARRKLRDRIRAIRGDRYVGPEEERLTVGELLDALETHLGNKGAKSVRSASSHIKTARTYFGSDRAVRLTAARIERYQAEELAREKPPAPATINRVIGVLRQAFRLARKQERISRVPYFPMLREENTRQGFVEPADFEKVFEALVSGAKPEPAPRIDGTVPKKARALPVPDLADAARFAYLTGWRRGQISKLRWEHVDRTNRLLMVPGALTKNRKPQTVALEGQLWTLIERRWERREVKREDRPTFISPYVFHRGDGKPIGDFRKAWATACSAVGMPHLLFHDLRRSAVRNLIRAGVDRDVARKISGHRTEAIFARYNITDERDQRAALSAVDRYLDRRNGSA